MRDAPIVLNVLDFSWVTRQASPVQSLKATLSIARRAESLGYHRVWVGEHHVRSNACGSPQVLAAILASTTRQIRIGIGALLLQYYTPLKVAEDFRLLETIFGRIDLGIGRGRADNEPSHRALLDGRAGAHEPGMFAEDTYSDKLDDLLGFLGNSLPEDHRYAGADVIPAIEVEPEIWICGSETAAVQAARRGAHFCCTLFHGREPGPAAVRRYRAEFAPSERLEAPHTAIAVCGVCADSEAEALEMQELFLHRRHYVPNVVGTPEQCGERLAALRETYGADEIFFLDLAPDLARRTRSLELLAQVCRLTPRT
jgi:luciferase family oxidoreductase group 1